MPHSFHAAPEPDPLLAPPLPIRVLLAISSRLERLGWSIIVQSQNDLQLAGECGTFDSALALMLAHRVDVALFDQSLLSQKHCEQLVRDSARLGCRILLMTSYPIDEDLASGRYSFASDCLLKGVSAEDLLAALRGPCSSTKRPGNGSSFRPSAPPSGLRGSKRLRP